MTREEQLKILSDKIKGMRTTIFVTMNDKGQHHGRPMSTQEVDFDGTVWFMTPKDSDKITDIKQNPNVGLMYGDGSIKFVSMTGTAAITDDKQKIHELWNDFYKAWFTGEDDPNIALIKVDIDSAEYWDHWGGKIGAYVDIAKSAIIGGTMDSDHEKFDL